VTSTPDESRCFDSMTFEALAGGMPPNEQQTAHLATCAGCRDAIEALGASLDLLDVAVRSGHGAAIDPGTRVPGYRLIREIHRGGQGVVWLAEQDGTRRLVAIKMLLAGVAATSVQRRRFEREIEVVASLSDPAIVTIFEQGVTSDGVPYYAMEFVEGRRFDDWVSERRPTTRVAVNMVATIAAAVGTAHRRGIIHRDLKPGNILIDEAELPRVLDFGLARLETERDFDATVAAVTEDGAFLGNFAYAAPEQLTGSPNAVDTSADVYALGLLLYEAIAGRPAFAAPDSIAALLGQRVGRVPQKPSIFASEVGHELDLIVLRSLDPEPDRRYATAGEFADDLHRLLDGRPVLARGDSIAYILRKAALRHLPITIVAGTSLLLILTAMIALAVLYRESERERVRADRGLVRAGRVQEVYRSAFEFVDPQAQGAIDLKAPDLLRRLEENTRSVLAEEPVDQAEILLRAGEGFCNLESIDDAERCFNSVLSLAERMPGEDGLALQASARHGLGRVEFFRGKEADRRSHLASRQGDRPEADRQREQAIEYFDAAEREYEQAFRLRATLPGVSRLDYLGSWQHLVGTRFTRLAGRGSTPDAESLRGLAAEYESIRSATAELPHANPEFEASTWNAIAMVRQQLGDDEGAIDAAREAAALAGEDEASSWAGRAQASLGTRLLQVGRADEAVTPLRQGVAICRRIFGERSSVTRRYWRRLVEAQLRSRRFDDALAESAELERTAGPDDLIEVGILRMDALIALERRDEAVALAGTLRAAVGDGSPHRGLELRRAGLDLDAAFQPTAEEAADLRIRWGMDEHGATD
jgi:tetratricopeptide (TPR) repeat protein/predicted Ser/Thr protein kinase